VEKIKENAQIAVYCQIYHAFSFPA